MDPELLRYSCQLALPGFTEITQQKLQNAKVLIVGAGGLGCPCAQYLAAVGIGEIGIADFDIISASNLHRQLLYTPAEVGLKKVKVISNKLQQQNPGIKIIPYDIKITFHNVMDFISQYDIVVDTTDNFETKYLLNDACVLTGRPLVYGAIYQYEGQVAVWNVLNKDGNRTPNYRDIFPEVNASEIPNCAEGGVIPTIAGIIGCMQANEVIKYFADTGKLLASAILIFDALTMQSRIIKTATVTSTSITELQQLTEVPEVSIKDFKNFINENYFELVDVRTIEERAEFNIGGTHIPMQNIEKDILYFNDEKNYLLYCASGSRSQAAARTIKAAFPDKNIFSLEGGLKAWQEGNV